MARLTRPKDEWECRHANCNMEDYLVDRGAFDDRNPCDGCPMEEIVNKLAEYEDAAELSEDDGK